MATQADDGPRFGGLYRSLVISAVLPLVTVLALQHGLGMPLVPALAISSVFPLGQTVVTWVSEHHLAPLGAMMLVIIMIGIAGSLISGDVHFALLKESFATLVLSAFFLGSLLAPKPLVFFLGKQFSTGGDPEKAARWDGRWQESGFRAAMRTLTAVWGIGYLIDAIGRAVATYTLPPNVVVVLSPLSLIGISVLLVMWTIGYSRRYRRTAGTSPA